MKFNELPLEIIQKVFLLLEVRDFLSASLIASFTSKVFEVDEIFWRFVYERDRKNWESKYVGNKYFEDSEKLGNKERCKLYYEYEKALFQIKLKTLSGVVYSLDVHPLDRVHWMKVIIWKRFKFGSNKYILPPVQQRLVFKGKLLHDKSTFEEIGIKKGNVVQLIVALK